MEWIEIPSNLCLSDHALSPPSRVEWIEMQHLSDVSNGAFSLRLRGWSGLKSIRDDALFPYERLRLRGWSGLKLPPADRPLMFPMTSPPSRVEWIEIRNLNYRQVQDSRLRLRGWSGLKLTSIISQMVLQLSPPSRVEWIEIKHWLSGLLKCSVSAFAGGVD